MTQPFSFTATPARVDPTQKSATGKRRFGLVQMAPGSQHQITIKIPTKPTQNLQVIARPFDSAPGAKVVHVCLHHGCNGKLWPDEATMRQQHPQISEMERRQEVHVWGLWSSDPADPTAPKVADCENCKKEKGGAPCAEHRGPVFGLIAPPEMRAVEG